MLHPRRVRPELGPAVLSDIITVADFMQQDGGQLAAFLRVWHDHCAELEGCRLGIEWTHYVSGE